MKYSYKVLALFILAFCFMGMQGIAQDQKVSGTVTSASDGLTLIGVNVIVKGTSTGTITDFDGKYQLNVPTGSSLTFSYVGFTTQTIEVGTQSIIDIAMADGETLSTVVITALGISRESKALGYAVEQVSAEEIAKSGQTNILSALQGRVSGVSIQNTSGSPGGGVDIVIRGMNSLDPNRSNQPLFVIDGVQISNSTDVLNTLPSAGPSDNNIRQQASISNRGVDINPDDIASVSVLKGAAATALYGSRASNGAIIITTKKGQKGKARIGVNASYGFGNVDKTPSIQTTYRDGRRGAVRYTSSGEHWYFQSQGPKVYDGHSPIHNFFDDIYQTSSTSNLGLNVSGGTDKSTYYISANTFNTQGVIPTGTYTKNNLRFGGSLDVSDRLKVRSSIAYTNSGGNKIHEGQKSVLSSLSFMNNSLDLTDYLNEDGSQKNPFLSIIDQPLYLLDVTHHTDNVNRYIADVGVEYTLTDWASLNYTLGTDIYTDERERFIPPGLDLSSQVNGFIYEQRILSRLTTSLVTLNFNKKISEKFSLSGVVGNEVFLKHKDALSARGEDFSITDFEHISNASQTTNTNRVTNENTIGLFGQVELGYANAIYLTISGRNDWSSTLPKANRSYFYPSASLALVLSDLVELPSFITFAKLRGSWAKVGKSALPYNDGTYYSQAGNFPFNGTNGFGKRSSVGNPNLLPEFTTSTEFGIDLRFFNNRVSIQASYYTDLSEDLLIAVPVSEATGADRVYTNAGSIKNTGIELLVSLTPIKTPSFRWDATVSWSQNEGEVISVNNELGYIELYNNPSRARGVSARFTEGGKIGDIWAHDFFRSPDGDLIIGSDGKPRVDNAGFYLVGNAVPDFVMNWSNSFSFKGLSFSFLWEWKKGGDVFDMGRRNGIRNGLLADTERRYEQVVFNGVVEVEDLEGNITYETNTQMTELDPESVQRSSSRFNNAGSMLLEDASWFRIRNMNLSYDLPKSLYSAIKASKITISVIANNVYLNTGFQGYDPETNYFGSGSNILGYTGLRTPPARTITGAIRVIF